MLCKYTQLQCRVICNYILILTSMTKHILLWAEILTEYQIDFVEFYFEASKKKNVEGIVTYWQIKYLSIVKQWTLEFYSSKLVIKISWDNIIHIKQFFIYLDCLF